MTLTRRERRYLSRCFASLPERAPREPHASINARARLRAHVDRVMEDGKIGLQRTGMDCDCTAYTHFDVVPFTGLLAFLKAEDEHRDWLDGPESTCLIRPSVARASTGSSRDLALEAFEEGHSHVVYL